MAIVAPFDNPPDFDDLLVGLAGDLLCLDNIVVWDILQALTRSQDQM